DTGGDIDGYDDIVYLAAVDSISQMDVVTGFTDFPATAKAKLNVACTWRALNWNYPNVDDFQAHIWTFYNYGTKTTDPFYLYFCHDWDIPANAFDRDAAVYDEDTWTGMTYNVDSELSGGMRFLNSAPYSMYTTAWEDSFWDEFEDKASWMYKQLWEPQIFNTRLTPTDYRTNYLAGPITLAPGEHWDFCWAFVFGLSLGHFNANNSALTETYEAGWKPPNPPPDAPYLILAPGDRKVTINWARNRNVNPKVNNDGTRDYTEYPDSLFSRSAESSVDPNTGLRDWDGYFIYRNMTGSGELKDGAWHLISELTSTYVKNTWGAIPDDDLDARYWTQTYWGQFVDEDPGLYNGFKYYYSVVAYDFGKALTNPTANVQTVTLRWKAKQDPSNVKVVPNPFIVSNPPAFINGVQFIHLPANCTIKIYSFSGDYILSLYHNDGTGDETWNLRNDNDQLVAPGVYFWVVESDQGTQKGKFVIIH
ncbi:MAG TPA: T9SS type A sorting domain-containing protein, partial [Firmicutes bacterium]|nr:T9SS type A sorting domain-containing protein [Bacillota bacterium]